MLRPARITAERTYRQHGPRKFDGKQFSGLELAQRRFTDWRDAVVIPRSPPLRVLRRSHRLSLNVRQGPTSSHTTREPRQIGPSPRGALFLLRLASQPGKYPEHHRENHAEQDAGAQWEIDGCVLAPPGQISGQPAQGQAETAQQQYRYACRQEQESEPDQKAPQIAHVLSLEAPGISTLRSVETRTCRCRTGRGAPPPESFRNVSKLTLLLVRLIQCRWKSGHSVFAPRPRAAGILRLRKERRGRSFNPASPPKRRRVQEVPS